MIKSNSLLNNDYQITESIDFHQHIKHIEDLAKKYIAKYEVEINIITEEENLVLTSIEEFIENKEQADQKIKTIAIIFQDNISKTIAIVAHYLEKKVTIVLTLESKEMNRNVEGEIKDRLKLSEIYDEKRLMLPKNQMIIEPIFNHRNFTQKSDKCFVVMPFSEDWSDRVNKRIKKVLSSFKIEHKRADNLYGENVLEDIWIAINEASLIIAETTGKNPNVFYEIGIAHTLGKNVIILTQNIEDIPFDFRMYRHIEYKDNVDGFNKLESELKKFIAARKLGFQ